MDWTETCPKERTDFPLSLNKNIWRVTKTKAKNHRPAYNLISQGQIISSLENWDPVTGYKGSGITVTEPLGAVKSGRVCY